MMQILPNKGDLVKLPQGVVMYRRVGDGDQDEMKLVFAEEVTKPSIAIYIEDFNERVSKVIYQDQIRYVYSEWIFNLEGSDAYQIDDNSRRNYQF